jgi:PKD repeat protein
MKQIITLVLLLFSITAFAQAPDWIGAFKIANIPVQIVSMATDGIGNCYITGKFGNDSIVLGSTVLVNSGSQDIFVAKYDSLGNALWAKSGKGISYDLTESITIDGSGNCYVTGNFYSDSITFDNITLYNYNFNVYTFFVVKYDSGGNLVWAKSGEGNGKGNAVAADSIGDLFFAGRFADTLVFDSIVLISKGTDDLFLVKFDSLGNALWAKNAGGTDSEEPYGLSADKNGNCYMCGRFTSWTISFDSIDLTNTVYPDPDAFIVRYNASGGVDWARSATGDGIEEADKVKCDDYGNSYLAGIYNGTSISFGSFILPHPVASDYEIFLFKFDSLGNVVWAKRAGSSKTDFLHGMSVGKNKDCYISGSFNGDSISFDSAILYNSFVNTPTYNFSDLFLTKYDSSGNVAWVKSASCYYNDTGIDVTSDQNGNYYLAGIFSDTSITLGTTVLPKSGSFIAKMYTIVPEASFYSSDTSWCGTASIDFFDQSTQNTNSWQWTFQGGVPYTSNSQNPTGINYPANGTFNVKLVACNTAGCDTILLPGFVTRYPNPPAPVIWLSQDTLYSTSAFSYQWWNQNGLITGATDSFYVSAAPGSYFVVITDSIGCNVSSNSVTIASIHEMTDNSQFHLFPNPFSTQTILKSDKYLNNATLIITNNLGEKIREDHFSGFTYFINRENLPGGIYFIQLMKNENLVGVNKLLIVE